MRRHLLPVALAGLLLTGCGLAATTPMRTAQPNAMAAKGATRSVSTLVDQARLEATLAVLTGKTAPPAGAAIPERGTTAGRNATREFLTTHLTTLGYTVEKHAYRNSGQNVFVRLMADQPTSEYVLVGAHLDSVKNAGANDNGTGTVAVLETARVLKNLEGRKVNVIFAWFDEEELGLVGSYAMARDFKKQGLNITSVHTIDMMGWDSDGDRAVEIEQPDGVLWDYYQMVNKAHGLNLKLTRTSSGSTDHVAFRESGFQAVGMCEEWAFKDTTPHYHKKSDTYETINFPYLTSSTRLLAAVIGDMAKGVKVSTRTRQVPHSQFPGRDRHFHGAGHAH